MIIKEIVECAKTGPETKYLLTLTDNEVMMKLTSRTLHGKLTMFSTLVADALCDFLSEKYKTELEREATFANEALSGKAGEGR
jgi:hypothetical protein